MDLKVIYKKLPSNSFVEWIIHFMDFKENNAYTFRPFFND